MPNAQPVRHVLFEVCDRAATSQFPAQQLGKNLQMTRAIDKSRAGFSNNRQPKGHGVSVSDGCALKTRGAFNAICLVEQLANGALRFARVALPLGDRV